MDTYGRKAFAALRAEIEGEIERRCERVIDGRCSGIEDYRANTGRIAGLRWAIAALDDTVKKTKEDNDV